jgi:glycosyltransferase involved in cell wall biosynthesis
MKVSIITCTIREQFMDNVFKNYERQQWDEKELIIILNKDELDLNKWQREAEKYPNVRVFQLHEGATLGDCLNFGILKANYDYIAKFDDDDCYGPNYLSNSMKVFENDEVFILGKSSYYVYFTNKKALMLIQNKENSFDESVSGATLIFRKEVYNKVQFQKRTRAEDYFFIEDCKKNGYKIFATSKDDFVVIRHESENHTWKITDEDFLTWGEVITYTDDFMSVLPCFTTPPIKKEEKSTLNIKLNNSKNPKEKPQTLKEVYNTLLKNTLLEYQNSKLTE